MNRPRSFPVTDDGLDAPDAGAGIAIQGGAVLIYQSGQLAGFTITGSTPGTNDVTLNGATTGRAWDETNNTFTTARTLSWTNMAAALTSGGFAGNARDVTSDARFLAAA